MRAARQLEEIDANQNAGEKSQRRQDECSAEALQPSEELAAVVGSGPLPRGQVVSKMWEYIRSHSLQNPANRREILADDKLRRVFGKDKVTMFEMNKHLAGHLK
jgi:chromatin remodeling complex protein RSC6